MGTQHIPPTLKINESFFRCTALNHIKRHLNSALHKQEPTGLPQEARCDGDSGQKKKKKLSFGKKLKADLDSGGPSSASDLVERDIRGQSDRQTAHSKVLAIRKSCRGGEYTSNCFCFTCENVEYLQI